MTDAGAAGFGTTGSGEFVVTYKGRVEGKAMSGTSETPMGAGEWKAEKVE